MSFCTTIEIHDFILHPEYQVIEGHVINDIGLVVLKDPFEVGFELNNCCS